MSNQGQSHWLQQHFRLLKVEAKVLGYQMAGL